MAFTDIASVTEAEKAPSDSRTQSADLGSVERSETMEAGRLPPRLVDCLDVCLITDARLRVERIEAFPPGFDPFGCSLIELARSGSQLALRRAAEECSKSGQAKTVVAELRGESIGQFVLKLSPIVTTSGPSLMLVGIAVGPAPDGLVRAERKRLENLDQLLNIVPFALFTKDADARFTWGNRNFLDSLEAESIADIWGRDDFYFHQRPEAERYFADDQRIVRTGQGIEEQQEHQTRANGEAEIVKTTKLPIRRPDGSIEGVMGFFTEVTETARVAERLEKSEQRYVLAALASRDGVWEFDMVENIIRLSKRARILLGVDEEEAELTWAEFETIVGQSEVELLFSAIEVAVNQPGVTVSHVLQFEAGEVEGGQVEGEQFGSAEARRFVELVGSALVERGEVVGLVGTAVDVTEERLRERLLIHQAGHDDLTGLNNRRALVRCIDQWIDEGRAGSMLYLDLDSFRAVNDSLGHSFGDDLLRATAERLTSIVPADSLVARIGADEFAVLIPGPDADMSEQTAKCIIDAIAKPFLVGDAEIYTTTSIGIVHLDASSTSAEEAVRDADIALYNAKDDGKACARVFDERMRRSADEELELHTRLRRAVEQGEFELHYQPIFETAGGQLNGVEALVRWNSPDGRQERPNVFLPYLEKTGLIKEVGTWVIDEGCRQLAEWRRAGEAARREGHPPIDRFYMAINLSRVQFEAENLIDVVTNAVSRHGLQPADLILEVTETAVSRDPELAAEVLANIQSLGVSIAIDDFGVGESSLSALYDMPANIVKIDKSFIDRITPDDDEPVISAVFQIARSLGLATVAEGVETELQRAWLADQQCDSLQGYLLSTPLPPDELAARWLLPFE